MSLALPVTQLWVPQAGPQHAFYTCPVEEILYGGARGGGKTDGSLGKWLRHAYAHGPHAKGIFFRRELTQLEAAIARSQELYRPAGAAWNGTSKTWRFPNGAVLKFRPLERDGDAEKYQGHDFTFVAFEELGNYPTPDPYNKIRGALRSAHGVPTQLVATANPGGPGHAWVKARFIDPAPQGFKILTDVHGKERVFIPAKVSDNRILLENDPGYVANLRLTGSEALVRAWLDGDWTVVQGAFFEGFSEAHILEPFEIPDWWVRFRAFDWGSAAPFSVGWFAVSDGSVPGVPEHALVQYREWYGAQKVRDAYVGLKLRVEDVALGILDREAPREKILYSVADTAIFAADGGPSQAERFAASGVSFQRADKKRVPGWDQLRARLQGDERGPALFFFGPCVHSIRTLPLLKHDERNPEDAETTGEDHAPDMIRYACMSRPWTRHERTKPPPDLRNPSLSELFKEHLKRKRRS